ncbi:hypothetical protein M113_3335 [Bacteroides fragilis str. 3986 N3]|nr:hypothetical protein M112_3360 [Bacteroides fragilis str. 3986 T(B)13]EYE66230.1 hypothetical protein M113_3335 [Bacteroides fragilis str. 3986 N3]
MLHFSDYTLLFVNRLMKQSSENKRKEITGELMESPINKS